MQQSLSRPLANPFQHHEVKAGVTLNLKACTAFNPLGNGIGCANHTRSRRQELDQSRACSLIDATGRRPVVRLPEAQFRGGAPIPCTLERDLRKQAGPDHPARRVRPGNGFPHMIDIGADAHSFHSRTRGMASRYRRQWQFKGAGTDPAILSGLDARLTKSTVTKAGQGIGIST